MDFQGLGINAKMSELQAAMGLAVLPYMEMIIAGRKKAIDFYNEHLDFSKLKAIKIRENTNWNYSYYPVVFQNEEQLLNAEKALNEQDIYPRRYFYPSLNTIRYTNGKSMPISESIASRILCLPVSFNFRDDELVVICTIINNVSKNL